MEDFEIIKIDEGGTKTLVDLVAEEVPATVFAGSEELVTLLATPSHLDELAIGFLYSSGLVEIDTDFGEVRVDARHWAVHVPLNGVTLDAELISKRLFTSGCGRGTLFYRSTDLAHSGEKRSETRLKATELLRLMRDFHAQSEIFQDTGGVHSAALCRDGAIVVMREDIGRHNAVDKVLGHALLHGLNLSDMTLLSSGRVSSEIVLKLRKTPIAMLVSRSAPTNQAIKHARGADITLVGFARGRRMNVYSAPRRVI